VQSGATAPAVDSQPVAQPSGVAPEAPLGNDSSVSKVPLPLILAGTLPGRNAREGEALIGVNESSPQTYKAGALLINGARLVEIYPKYVVLEKNGRFAQLYLQNTKGSADANDEVLVVGGVPEAEATAVVPMAREELTDYIRPSPVYEGDRLKGYEVYPGQKVGSFARLGLQGGDVITALNDAPFSDPQEAIERLRQVVRGTPMTATIQRKGEFQQITLDGSALAEDTPEAARPTH
jgi:general secretion pathway protein C